MEEKSIYQTLIDDCLAYRDRIKADSKLLRNHINPLDFVDREIISLNKEILQKKLDKARDKKAFLEECFKESAMEISDDTWLNLLYDDIDNNENKEKLLKCLEKNKLKLEEIKPKANEKAPRLYLKFKTLLESNFNLTDKEELQFIVSFLEKEFINYAEKNGNEYWSDILGEYENDISYRRGL